MSEFVHICVQYVFSWELMVSGEVATYGDTDVACWLPLTSAERQVFKQVTHSSGVCMLSYLCLNECDLSVLVWNSFWDCVALVLTRICLYKMKIYSSWRWSTVFLCYRLIDICTTMDSFYRCVSTVINIVNQAKFLIL